MHLCTGCSAGHSESTLRPWPIRGPGTQTREAGTALLSRQCCRVDLSVVPGWIQRDECRALGTLSHPQPLWAGHTFG